MFPDRLLAGATGFNRGNPVGYVFRYNNHGTDWTALGTPSTGSWITSFARSGTNLFAGSYFGGVLLSSDNGISWHAVNSGLTNMRVTSLTVSGTSLLAGTYGGGVFLSTDNGSMWSATNTGLADTNIAAFAVLDENVFAGTYDCGVFLSTNGGKSWVAVNSKLTNTQISVLAISGTNLYAGTNGGLWSRPLAEMIMGVYGAKAPTKFALDQNYPNPFNPTTSISYRLATVSHVTLKVFDVLGREIQTMVDERENAGEHSVRFNAGDLPSGVYFYRLHAGTFTETKKLMVLK